MRYRNLGRENLKVSVIGYGCPTFSGQPKADYEANAIAILHRAQDLGVTYIDSADHNEGNNELILAKAFKGRWDKVVVSTKVGNRKSWPGSDRDVDGRPESLTRLCEESLTRFGTDCIDLLYLHRVDPAVPIEDSIGALQRLVVAGKARHIGMSEAGPQTLKRGNAVHPITAVQSEYSLWTREYEADTLPAADALGIGFVAYYPMGRGFLSGAIASLDDLPEKDARRKLPRFEKDNFAKNLELRARFKTLAANKGCTPSQLALAWLVHQKPTVVPIPGTLTMAHLEENAAAAEVALTAEEMVAIDRIFPVTGVAGPRFGEDRSKELNI
jgi:aryl-alcohol dehydrogenase-like predicted oxidoreductase